MRDLQKQYDTALLQQGLWQFSLSAGNTEICQFLRYYELLTEWNSFMNLTAITGFPEVVTKHFIDSLSLASCMDLSQTKTMIDLGTGAGFPGIPLKIMFPHLRVTLLDSLKKRLQFLETVVAELGLTDVELIHGRAEDFAKLADYREKYDLCVSRAVANLSTLSEYCIPFVTIGGTFAAYKSEKGEQEAAASRKVITLLGGSIEKQTDFRLPETELCRTMILIKKTKATPPKYPRKAGLPAKEPLGEFLR